MDAPLEQTPSTSEGVGEEAALTGAEKPQRISAPCEELSGMISRGVTARIPMCNEHWHYESLLKYKYYAERMGQWAAFTNGGLKLKCKIKRRALHRRYLQERAKLCKEEMEMTEIFKRRFKKKEKSGSEQEVPNKTEEEVNGKEEELEVANANLEKEEEEREAADEIVGKEEFAVKLEGTSLP